MQISAYSKYLDYPAKTIYARAGRRLPGEDLIRKVSERTEEEHRRAAPRRRSIPDSQDDRDGDWNVVPAFFAVSARRDANAETVQVAPTVNTTALWSLIDAVEAGGSPCVSPQPTDDTSQKSPAEALYLLLAQVIADD